MPPEGKPQPSAAERDLLRTFLDQQLLHGQNHQLMPAGNRGVVGLCRRVRVAVALGAMAMMVIGIMRVILAHIDHPRCPVSRAAGVSQCS